MQTGKYVPPMNELRHNSHVGKMTVAPMEKELVIIEDNVPPVVIKETKTLQPVVHQTV